MPSRYDDYLSLREDQHAELERYVNARLERQIRKYARMERGFAAIVGGALDEFAREGWTTRRGGEVFLAVETHGREIRRRLGLAEQQLANVQERTKTLLLGHLARARPVSPFIAGGRQRDPTIQELWERAVADYRALAKEYPEMRLRRADLRRTIGYIDDNTRGRASNVLAVVENDVRKRVYEPLRILATDPDRPFREVQAWARRLETFHRQTMFLSETAHQRAVVRNTLVSLGRMRGASRLRLAVPFWRFEAPPASVTAPRRALPALAGSEESIRRDVERLVEARVRPNGILERVLFEVHTIDEWRRRVEDLYPPGPQRQRALDNLTGLGIHPGDFSRFDPIPDSVPAAEIDARTKADRAAMREAIRKYLEDTP